MYNVVTTNVMAFSDLELRNEIKLFPRQYFNIEIEILLDGDWTIRVAFKKSFHQLIGLIIQWQKPWGIKDLKNLDVGRKELEFIS